MVSLLWLYTVQLKGSFSSKIIVLYNFVVMQHQYNGTTCKVLWITNKYSNIILRSTFLIFLNISLKSTWNLFINCMCAPKLVSINTILKQISDWSSQIFLNYVYDRYIVTYFHIRVLSNWITILYSERESYRFYNNVISLSVIKISSWTSTLKISQD